MSRSTLTPEDINLLFFVGGVLAANPGTKGASDAVRKLVDRQRALGKVPTESVQVVADKLGDQQLAQRPYRTMKERNATAEAIEAVQRASKVVAGSARPLYGTLSDDASQQPNVDDRRRANSLPSSFAFRVTTGAIENVFVARRVLSVGGGGFEVKWLTGEKRGYTPEWVAMQLRLDRWRPTHDPITVGGES